MDPFEHSVDSKSFAPTCQQTLINNNSLHLYNAFLGTKSTLHRKEGGGGVSSFSTSVQHPPG